MDSAVKSWMEIGKHILAFNPCCSLSLKNCGRFG
jgi:hypothetical protein